MSSHRKSIAAICFALAIPLVAFIEDAAGQMTLQGQPQRTKTQTGKKQAGTMQGGVMQPGMMAPGMAPHGAPGAAKSNETYSIVQVGIDYQIVTASSLKSLKKSIEDEYKSADRAYQAAKRDKNNKGVTLTKPTKKTIKVVPGKAGIKTMEKAEQELQKLLNSQNKSGKKTAR
ncbi:MAG: hypothetical protein IT426_03870 [Pirellulales bacterium]|nr:hypothetical protein [Pirellulales bacterium]